MRKEMQDRISIVVPLFNEEESVVLLYKAIVDAIQNSGKEFELIFVDDGSCDNTFETARGIAKKDERLRVVKFRRNYGQTPAMAAGIEIASGGIIITMDGDLQNDPIDIPRFVEKIEEGYDIVVGWRFNRQDKLISRKIPSRIANWLIGKVTGVPIKDNGCSLKAYRSDVIKHVPLYSEMHRFIPAMASIAGSRIAEIKVRHHARQFGESKYGLSRVYKVLLDLLTIKMIASFSARPLAWFATLAAPFMIFSMAMIGWVMWTVVADGYLSLPVAGTAMFLGILVIFLFFSGAIAELVNRTSKHRHLEFSLLTATEVTESSSNLEISDFQGQQNG
jgi:glycosyltransferase involved in cell wall biosynthesis